MNCYPIAEGSYECLPDDASEMAKAILAAKYVEYLKTKTE